VVLFDHTIAVTVTDSGVGFDHERVGFSCHIPLSPNGRGLFLISSVNGLGGGDVHRRHES